MSDVLSPIGHMAHCTMPVIGVCSCGSIPRTEPEARAACKDAKRADREQPEYWIVTDYGFFEHSTLRAAELERDKLFERFPGKSFRVIRCKRKLTPSRTKLLLTGHDELVEFVATIARMLLNGEEPADREDIGFEQKPDDAIDSLESLIVRARAIVAKIGGAS